MRLFIAIQLSEEMKSSLLRSMEELKKAGVKGRYVPAGNLHLTLAFIGETDEDTCGKIKAAMNRVSFRPFRLSLGEFGNFGDLLWVGLKDRDASDGSTESKARSGSGATGSAVSGNDASGAAVSDLETLVRELRAELDAAGIPYDRKRFRPHITLIRKAAGNWAGRKISQTSMTVDRISLMKSELKDGKRVYTTVSTKKSN